MILDEKVMIFIVLASEIFQKRSSAIFKKHGLTFSQYNVLKYLGACEGGWNRVGNVGKHMLVTGANVTGLAKRMQKAGLIERKNDDERRAPHHPAHHRQRNEGPSRNSRHSGEPYCRVP